MLLFEHRDARKPGLTNEGGQDQNKSLSDKRWEDIAQALPPSCGHEDKHVLSCAMEVAMTLPYVYTIYTCLTPCQGSNP
jgi:hypothetical protein